MVFPLCFLMLCANVSLTKNSIKTDITCNLTRYCFAIVIGEEMLFVPVRIELSVFLETSFLHSFFVKLLYLTKYYFITSTMHTF